MSLLERGPHVVEVTTKVPKQTSLGTDFVPGTPVTLKNVAVQPISSEEAQELGVTVDTIYRVIGKGQWPGGALSTVKVITGPVVGLYDQHADAEVYGMSPRTSHYDVLIRKRGTESR